MDRPLLAPGGELLLCDPEEVIEGRAGLSLLMAAERLRVGVLSKDTGIPGFGRMPYSLLIAAEGVPFSGAPQSVVGSVGIESASCMAIPEAYLGTYLRNSPGDADMKTTYVDGTGLHWYCALHGPPPEGFAAARPFTRFSDRILELGGQSVNDLVESGKLRSHQHIKNSGEFSSNGARVAWWSSSADAGWIRQGDDISAFCLRSGPGDGRYTVFGEQAIGGDSWSIIEIEFWRDEEESESDAFGRN